MRNIPLIENEHEAEIVMQSIRGALENLVKLEAQHADAIVKAEAELTALKKKFIEEEAALDQRINDHMVALYRFAKTHRRRLAGEGKFIRLPLGSTIRWLSTSKIIFKNVERIKKYVTEHNLTDFFRTEIILKKKPMATKWGEAKRIPGVKKETGENFLIKPMGVEEALSRSVKSLDYILSPRENGEGEGELARKE